MNPSSFDLERLHARNSSPPSQQEAVFDTLDDQGFQNAELRKRVKYLEDELQKKDDLIEEISKIIGELSPSLGESEGRLEKVLSLSPPLWSYESHPRALLRLTELSHPSSDVFFSIELVTGSAAATTKRRMEP